jgi:hypothetical protein
VPLVELKTTNDATWYTDSNGMSHRSCRAHMRRVNRAFCRRTRLRRHGGKGRNCGLLG